MCTAVCMNKFNTTKAYVYMVRVLLAFIATLSASVLEGNDDYSNELCSITGPINSTSFMVVNTSNINLNLDKNRAPTLYTEQSNPNKASAKYPSSPRGSSEERLPEPTGFALNEEANCLLATNQILSNTERLALQSKEATNMIINKITETSNNLINIIDSLVLEAVRRFDPLLVAHNRLVSAQNNLNTDTEELLSLSPRQAVVTIAPDTPLAEATTTQTSAKSFELTPLPLPSYLDLSTSDPDPESDIGVEPETAPGFTPPMSPKRTVLPPSLFLPPPPKTEGVFLPPKPEPIFLSRSSQAEPLVLPPAQPLASYQASEAEPTNPYSHSHSHSHPYNYTHSRSPSPSFQDREDEYYAATINLLDRERERLAGLSGPKTFGGSIGHNNQ
ncbi:hypothetical protein NEDG_02030 [Nematocida displodere]|uniref:Uncharacterized protein n=1 Tax=Nematocida displodere TaxID=1805483 RepID=A0A177EF62_9MICR|nr:hypothetical protein NEDG_02030 [Nematocida displodere]